MSENGHASNLILLSTSRYYNHITSKCQVALTAFYLLKYANFLSTPFPVCIALILAVEVPDFILLSVVCCRYYYNKKTKQSTWEKPFELMTLTEVGYTSLDA